MNTSSTLEASTLSRREFVQMIATGTGLALSLQLPELSAAEAPPARAAGVRSPAAFIRIAPDDTITIVTPSVELGQGAHTGMPMIIMEELGGNWARVVVQDAPAATVYRNPMMGRQATVGSFSVRGWYNDLRKVGAAAREMLVQAAANQWSVPASECKVERGVITHAAGHRATFGQLADQAAKLPVPENPVLKAPDKFQLIGKDRPRIDVPHKVDGSAKYGVDVILPDMLHAAVKTCPTFGGTLKSFDDSAAKQVSGYHATVPLTDGVIVVARSFWQAKKALEQVKVEYDLGPLATLDSAKVSATLHAGFDRTPGVTARNDGDAVAALKGAKTVLEAVYEAPYLAHACMEPMNCVARVDDNGCEVWCGTQSAQAAEETAAQTLGIPAERIKINAMLVGGGFGRRGQADYVAHAVTAAKAVGRPVKVLWTREEDIQHDWYRPASAVRFRAALDAQDKLTGIEATMVDASAPGPTAAHLTGGVADSGYNIPNFRVTGLNADLGVRFGYWRSVSHSHHPFMFEGFIDEIARRLKQDPYQFRRSLLQREQDQRLLRVIDMAAEKAGWGKAPKGHHQGICAFPSYGSFVATVAEVSVSGKQVTLHRIINAIDCGVAIYPDNIMAQLEGGMAFGLAAVLRGEITLDKGAVKQSNFHDYPMLMMTEMPTVQSYIVPSTAPPGGVGEPGTGPIAPALANAIYAATGERIRSLPLSKHGYTYAARRV
jgi:isoquinoline 1-oxidoreductase subunit beta